MNEYDKQHLRNIARIERMVEALFQAAATDAANLSTVIGELGDTAFSWDDYPLAHAKINDIIARLNSEVEAAIVNGVRSEWTLSNNKNNELCRQVFGSLATSLPTHLARRYFSTNESARDAFLARRENGLNLSDNVWRYTNQFKGEIEMALDIGIRSGRSADEISRDVREYLKEPHKLFRRVRDEHGQLQLSKNAAAYHPGRGVYRSSYMNARRLAATETNIAYRTADHLRWQQLDFVVGIEIHLSNNHNCKGVPAGMFFDICDELKGKYPKDFQFTGWHPHCRCYATSILKTEEEMAADNARIMAGEDVQEGSENEVRELPKNFTDWVANNQERIDRAKSLPYFYRDNKDLIIQQTTPKQKGILELAAERHASRTPEQVAAIQEKWNTRRLQGISEQFYGLNLDATDPLTGRFLKLLMHTDSPSFADDFSALRTDVQKAWDAERKAVEKIQRQLGIKRGKHSAWAQAMLKEEKKNAARKDDFTTSKQTLTVAKKSKECNVSTTRGGIPIVKPTSCRSQSYKPNDFLAPLSKLPIELRGTLQRIDLVDWYNPDDAYWRKQYKNFTSSWATGGNGTVTFYRNTKAEAAANDLLYTLSHECGHNLDRKHGGSGWLSEGKIWQDAMAADKKKSSLEAVTEYGKNSPHEDFADSCMLYVSNPSKLKSTFPNRYKIIRALLHRY